MKTAWLSLLTCSLVGTLAVSACEIKEGDPDNEGGEAGEESGGRGSGGKSSGGTGGTTSGGKSSTGGASSGGTSSGGKASTGGESGMGGEGPMCDLKLGTPASSCAVPTDGLPAATAACLTCLSKASNCCAELKDCYATSPSNECGYGGPADNPGETEYLCFQGCVLEKAAANGGIIDDNIETQCAGLCTRCGAISDETNAVITCMHTNCEAECFTP